MVDDEVVRPDVVRDGAVIDVLVLRALVRVGRDDVRPEARLAQHAPDAERLVADRVAVAEGRENLVDGLRHRSTAPAGAAFMICRPGGSVRARCAKYPGSAGS